MFLYSAIVRPLLFGLDAERAHDVVMQALRSGLLAPGLGLLPVVPDSDRLRNSVWGLDFRNPVGLAAGLDKQGTAAPAWARMGFAFAEMGTVTPQPQPGNERPRLFRLPLDGALINRFGFNSEGADAVATHLARGGRPPGLRVGVNVGKNKVTPNERAADDYTAAIRALHPFADYFVVNVSSPNTAGLRDLQEAHQLRRLVEQVVACVRACNQERDIPVLVKLSPDMSERALLEAVDACLEGGASGLIATNTTTSRDDLRTHAPLVFESGGLSGRPLRDAANAICQTLYRHVRGRVPIIGVGGIFTPGDAYERIRSGASLVQVYTGLIYDGPDLVYHVVQGLLELLERDGCANVRDAIGIDVR